MAKYESRYESLGFYVNEELKRFNNGQYVTDVAEEIEVLNVIADAVRVDKEETKTEAKPATKAPARKASAK